MALDSRLLAFVNAVGADVKALFVSRGLSVFCSGTPSANEVIGGGVAPHAFTISQARCYAYAKTAPTASTTFTITNGGVNIGSITFASFATLGTILITNASIARLDNIEVVAPANLNGIATVKALISA